MTEHPQTSPERKSSIEDKFPRSLWIRLIIYIAVGHLFAGFIWLLFELGAQK